MALSLRTVLSGYFSTSKLNQNFTDIEDKVNDDLLHRRNGSAQMEQNIDMNSNSLLNVPDPTTDNEVANKKYIDDRVGNAQLYSDIAEGYAAAALVSKTNAAASEATSSSNAAAASISETNAAGSAVEAAASAASIDTINAETISTLLSVDTLVHSTVLVKNYHTGLEGGGGLFYWDATKDKSEHNGGTVIDPTAIFPTDWTELLQLTDWFNSYNFGKGCWVRQEEESVSVKVFGAAAVSSVCSSIPITKAINSIKNKSYRKVIDLCGDTFYISQTISFTGIFNIKLQNGKLRAHDDFTAGYCIHLPVGSGNIAIDDVYIDGRKDDLSQVMDGILWEAGSNHLYRIEGRGFPNFGVHVANGTDGMIVDCDLQQWSFDEVENGQTASRTAVMYSIETGDVYIRGCVGQYCLYPIVSKGVGTHYEHCHFYNGASSGDVVTAHRPYNAFIEQGSSPKFVNCYFDNGTILAHQFYFSCKSCHFNQVADAAFSPVCFEFAPQSPTEYLNGLHITDSTLTGVRSNGDALLATNWIEVNTENGDFVQASQGQNNPLVKDNTYHKGEDETIMLPSTGGSLEVRIRPSGTATGDQYNWESDGATYKSRRVSDNQGFVDFGVNSFLPEYISYTFFISSEAEADFNISQNVWAQKVSGENAQIIIRSDVDKDSTIHTFWDGSYRKVL